MKNRASKLQIIINTTNNTPLYKGADASSRNFTNCGMSATAGSGSNAVMEGVGKKFYTRAVVARGVVRTAKDSE